MRPGMRALAALALALVAASAVAASRARFGGTLKVAVTGREPVLDPPLADTPGEAALAALVAPSVCRLDAAGRIRPVLASELARSGPNKIRLALRPGLSAAGVPVGPQEILQSWARLTQKQLPSPYRALLFPLRDEGRTLSPGLTPGAVELPLAFPWPDLEKSLCHPALGIVDAKSGAPLGLGAYTPSGGRWHFTANAACPEGRPYPDKLSLSATTERGAARVLALKQAHVLIGAADDASTPPPALFATYLAFTPSRAGNEFRQLFEASVDRGDLTRFFVRAPSVPMHGLLPPALMAQPAPQRQTPPPTVPPRELALLYDASLEDQRAVAERIQVKLHDRGLKVSLKALPRAELRARWASGDFDLMLHALLLPPLSAPALAVVMEAAGRHELLQPELMLIGAVADPAARDAKVRERAELLRLNKSLPFIPLYAQGLRVQASSAVAGLSLDAQGLPFLDQLFLTE